MFSETRHLQACAAKTAVELIPTLSGDYPAGTALYKYQWDEIHDPQRVWFSWMEEEEEGALRTRYCSVKGDGETRGLPNVNKEYYSFLAPSNKPISVSKTVTELRFSETFECNIEDNYADRLQSPDYNVDINANQKLTSFKIGETQYKARINNNYFEGYYAVKDNDFGFPVKIPSGLQYEDIYTPKNSSVEIYLPEQATSFTVCTATFEAKAPYYADGDITASEVPCSQDYNTTVESFVSLLEEMINDGNYIKQTWRFLDETAEKVYKDKFSVFNSETGCKSIYVLSHPFSFNMPESQKSDFAKAVTEKCGNFDKEKIPFLPIADIKKFVEEVPGPIFQIIKIPIFIVFPFAGWKKIL